MAQDFFRSRFDSLASEHASTRSLAADKVPYLLRSSIAWLALRGYHVWCMLVGLCITVLVLIEIFLNEYVMFFSNPWVIGTEAESLCIAAASLTSVVLLSWGSHVCHTGVLLLLDAGRDDSFLVFRSLFCLARLNSRTGLPVSGSIRAGRPLWKFIDLIVQVLIYGSLDFLPLLVALANGRASDWLTCIAWVSFGQMVIFWCLVCLNDYVTKYTNFRRLCIEYPVTLRDLSQNLPQLRWQSRATPAACEDAPSEAAERCDSCGVRCSAALEAFFSPEGQRLSTVIPYAEHWEINLQNYFVGRRAEDYLITDQDGQLVCAEDLEGLREERFPLHVYRLQDAPSPNLCLMWCDWLHRQSSRLACFSLFMLALVVFITVWAQEVLLMALSAMLFCFCALHLLRKHCVLGRTLERSLVIKSEEERWRLIDAIDHQLCLKEAVKLCGVDLPAGSQLVDDVGGGFSGMDAFLRRTPLGHSAAVAVRLEKLDPWSDYWETFCGCSPDHLIQGSLLYTVCGLVICLVLFFTRYFAEGIWGLLLILVLASPAIGLKAFPEHARLCHVIISMVVAALALIFSVSATRSSSFLVRSLVLLVCSQCLLPRKLHSMRRISLCFTVVLMLLLSSFISVSLSALVKGDLKPPHLSEQTFQFPPFGQINPWSPENFTAAPCTMFYGTTDDTVALPLVDFALFNKLVYMPDESLRKHNRDWLPHWELVYEQRRERRCSPKDGDCDVGDWTSWFVFQGLRGSKLEDTMVVTIRGTKTPLDYILDLDLWSGALMQQLFSNVLLTGPPVSAFLTSDLARQWYKGKKVHYASIHDFLQRQQKRNEKLIYLTGHSLGGGIANLLGAEFGIPSIAFSPPGVRSTAILLDINPVRLQALAVDVIPDRDPVVRTGDHGTVQLPIACADHWPMCHRIFNSVCELFDTCGDQAQPPRALPCDFCPAKLRQRPRLAPHCGHPTGRDRTWNG